MPFPVACPECDYRFRVPDGVAGKRGKCPKCQAAFIAQPAADDGPTKATAARPADEPAPSVSIPKPRMLASVTKSPPPPAAKAPPAKAAAAPPKSAQPSAAAPSSATPIIQIAPAAGESGANGAHYPHRRKRRSNKAALVAVAGLLLVALLAVGGGVAWSMYGSELFAVAKTGDGDSTANNASAPGENGGETIAATPADMPAVDARRPESLVPTVEASALRALVEIQVINGAGGTRSGVGVLVDKRGWVATSFMLLQGGSAATVTLSDGRRMEVAGWLGRDPQHNLALLKLAGGDGDLTDLATLKTNSEFNAAPGVPLFVLLPNESIPATYASQTQTAALPASSRPLLPEPLRDGVDMHWLTHDVRTADEADGSPLVDAEGRLIGLNAALGPIKRGYAIPMRYLKALQDSANDSRFAALSAGERPPTRSPNPEPTPTKGNPLSGPLAKFQSLHRLLKAANWRPAGAEDYEDFQLFALLVTIAHEMIDKGEIGPLQQESIREVTMSAMEDLEHLANAEWPNEEEMIRVNRLATAAAAMENPGLFAYGRCVMRPEHFGAKTIDGLPIFAFELIGTKQLVIVPAGENGSEIRMSSRWLLLGRKDLDENFPAVSLPNAPEVKREARVLRAKFILGGSAD